VGRQCAELPASPDEKLAVSVNLLLDKVTTAAGAWLATWPRPSPQGHNQGTPAHRVAAWATSWRPHTQVVINSFTRNKGKGTGRGELIDFFLFMVLSFCFLITNVRCSNIRK
jgi:hypothetical protein